MANSIVEVLGTLFGGSDFVKQKLAIEEAERERKQEEEDRRLARIKEERARALDFGELLSSLPANHPLRKVRLGSGATTVDPETGIGITETSSGPPGSITTARDIIGPLSELGFEDALRLASARGSIGAASAEEANRRDLKKTVDTTRATGEVTTDVLLERARREYEELGDVRAGQAEEDFSAWKRKADYNHALDLKMLHTRLATERNGKDAEKPKDAVEGKAYDMAFQLSQTDPSGNPLVWRDHIQSELRAVVPGATSAQIDDATSKAIRTYHPSLSVKKEVLDTTPIVPREVPRGGIKNLSGGLSVDNLTPDQERFVRGE